MSTKFLVLALLPLLFISEGRAFYEGGVNLTFPNRERDMSRITSFQILCEEGGECDEKYISKNLRRLESHFRAYQKVLAQESRQHGLPMTNRIFVEIQVVGENQFKKIVARSGFRGAVAEIGVFFTKEVVYLRGKLVADKQDYFLKAALSGYIGILYSRVFKKTPSPEYTVRLAERTAVLERSTVSTNALREP